MKTFRQFNEEKANLKGPYKAREEAAAKLKRKDLTPDEREFYEKKYKAMDKLVKKHAFGEETLEEGNPLARFHTLQQRGHHTVTVSVDRKDVPDEVNRANRKKLRVYLQKNKIGHRHVEGSWDEGSGVQKEKSVHLIASKPGEEGAAELRKHAENIARISEPAQDAYIETDPQGVGRAKYTRDTGSNKKGDVIEFGKTRYNTDNPYGETRYYPRRKTGPKFTFKEG